MIDNLYLVSDHKSYSSLLMVDIINEILFQFLCCSFLSVYDVHSHLLSQVLVHYRRFSYIIADSRYNRARQITGF